MNFFRQQKLYKTRTRLKNMSAGTRGLRGRQTPKSWPGGSQPLKVWAYKNNFQLIIRAYNNNNNDDRLTAFDPGQPG